VCIKLVTWNKSVLWCTVRKISNFRELLRPLTSGQKSRRGNYIFVARKCQWHHTYCLESVHIKFVATKRKYVLKFELLKTGDIKTVVFRGTSLRILVSNCQIWRKYHNSTRDRDKQEYGVRLHHRRYRRFNNKTGVSTSNNFMNDSWHS